MRRERRRILAAAGAGVAMLAGATAHAQDRQPIRVLVGFPPGGGTDAIARAIAERLPAHLDGQRVIIENIPGAGGRIAADTLMRAKPDGLTYMVAPNATPTFQTLVFGDQIRWSLWRDFAAVAGLASYPLGMAVGTGTGAKSAREFVDWLRRNPSANAGTPGMGGQNHFLLVDFARKAGVELPLVPYKGSPPLIADLLGGHVAAAVTLGSDLLKHHRAGKANLIGIFAEKRSSLMPDIPTMAEQGIDVTNGQGWSAMWAPVRTPAVELERMQRALRTLLATADMRALLAGRLNVEADFRDARAMEAAQRAEIAYWGPIIRASGFKPK